MTRIKDFTKDDGGFDRQGFEDATSEFLRTAYGLHTDTGLAVGLLSEAAAGYVMTIHQRDVAASGSREWLSICRLIDSQTKTILSLVKALSMTPNSRTDHVNNSEPVFKAPVLRAIK
jgi:hypothetical protein